MVQRLTGIGAPLQFEFRNRKFQKARAGLEWVARELAVDFQRAAPVLRRELQATLKKVTDTVIKKHSRPWPRGTTRRTLSTRSGRGINQLRRSRKVTGVTLDEIEAEIVVKGYMAIHETGAWVRGKGKLIPVPLPAALDGRGVPLKKRPRQWPNTFVARSKAGNLIIFQKQSDGGLVPLYVLKKRIRVPKRLGLQAALDKEMPHFVQRAMDKMARAITRQSR